MNEIQLGKVKHSDVISAKNVTVDGNRQSVDEFVGLLDTFPFWFNIITPQGGHSQVGFGSVRFNPGEPKQLR